MKPPHVLITTDTWGGVWTFTRELAYQLRRKNWTVTLACLGKPPDVEKQKKLAAWKVEFHSAEWRLEWMPESRSDVEKTRDWLRELVRRMSPDLLHANQFCAIGSGHSGRELLTVHSDVISWWRQVRGEAAPDDAYHAWYRQLGQTALRQAARVTAPSRAAAEDALRSFDLHREIFSIPNGLSPAFFHPYLEKQNYALAAGRWWDAGKQMSWLAEQDWPLPLALAGADAAPGMRPVNPRVCARNQFLGELDQRQMRQWLGHAAAMVSASRYEPFGLTALEAAFSRCLLVLSDLPSQRELWGEHALYFPAPGAEGARAGLERHLAWRQACPDAARARAHGAWRHALRQFTGERMAQRYLALYRKMLSPPRLSSGPMRPAPNAPEIAHQPSAAA